jgi:hypothetical protein
MGVSQGRRRVGSAYSRLWDRNGYVHHDDDAVQVVDVETCFDPTHLELVMVHGPGWISSQTRCGLGDRAQSDSEGLEFGATQLADFPPAAAREIDSVAGRHVRQGHQSSASSQGIATVQMRTWCSEHRHCRTANVNVRRSVVSWTSFDSLS